MDTFSQKALIRKELLAARGHISIEERKRRSLVACAQLENLAAEAFARQGAIGVYFSIGSEVQLDAFIQSAYKAGCSVAFPFMVRDDEYTDGGNLPHSGLLRMLSVPESGYGTRGQSVLADVRHPYSVSELLELEAEGVLSLDPPELDFQVIPLVGFDDDGMRMGYGKGCYDRYFEALPKLPTLVGVAFAEQKRPNLPAEPHDVALPRIVVA